MEIWAGINASAGRKKDQGIGMHPVCATCSCARLYEGLYACACLHEGVKPDAQHAYDYSTKVLNLINIFIEISWDIYMNTQICAVVSGAMPAGKWEKERERMEEQNKEKMNDTENRKIKRFIVWVRHAFIILIGSV